MKKNLLTYFACLGLLLFTQTTMATVFTKNNTDQSVRTTFQRNQSKQFAMDKKMARVERLVERLLAAHGYSSNEPVNKWLWAGLVLILGSLVLGLLNLGGLAYVAGVVGLVCLLVWLIKII